VYVLTPHPPTCRSIYIYGEAWDFGEVGDPTHSGERALIHVARGLLLPAQSPFTSLLLDYKECTGGSCCARTPEQLLCALVMPGCQQRTRHQLRPDEPVR
jgi:hypothetical protein